MRERIQSQIGPQMTQAKPQIKSDPDKKKAADELGWFI